MIAEFNNRFTQEEVVQLEEAGKNGDVSSMLKLGVFYLTKTCGEKRDEGIKWLERAGHLECEEAMVWLIYAYSGVKREASLPLSKQGVNQPMKFYWCLKAAQAYENPMAMFELGKVYAKGTNPDKEISQMWFKKAFDAGYREGMMGY